MHCLAETVGNSFRKLLLSQGMIISKLHANRWTCLGQGSCGILLNDGCLRVVAMGEPPEESPPTTPEALEAMAGSADVD